MNVTVSVRTLRTFQVFRAAYKLDTGEQGYVARQQHREAAQVHISLPAGLRGRGVPSETQIRDIIAHVRTYTYTNLDLPAITR